MTRRLLLLAVVAFGPMACAPAAPPAPTAQEMAADEAKLKADALIWFDHYAKGDADALANLYADDALLMPPGAPAATGKAAIKAFLGEDAAKSKAGGITLKNASVTGTGISGDVGWISGTYTVHDPTGATIDSGSYLSVHRRTKGAWPYIRDTWNSDRPPAAVPPPPPPPTKKGGE